MHNTYFPITPSDDFIPTVRTTIDDSPKTNATENNFYITLRITESPRAEHVSMHTYHTDDR
jgi:hypothetical protein